MKKLPDEVLQQIIPLDEYITDDPEYERAEGTSEWFYTCKNTRACYINYGGKDSGFFNPGSTWLFEMHGDRHIVEKWLEEHGGEDHWQDNLTQET